MQKLPITVALGVLALGCGSRYSLQNGNNTTGNDNNTNQSGDAAVPFCGDGVIDPGEECDGADLGGTSCQSLGLGGGSLACTPGCQLDLGGCASCGDGVADPGEECDGTDLAGQTCQDFGYSEPAGLACHPSCLLDNAGCTATCDGNLLEPGEECDGADLGGASCQDLGFTNPAGMVCDPNCTVSPQNCANTCGDGVAEPGEDCDGADLAGGDCTAFGFTSPAGLSCDVGCVFDPRTCSATCGDGLAEPGEPCDGNDLGALTCQDFGFGNPAGLACSPACQPDPSGCTATCGNNLVEPGEACDDGNTTPGDGCDSACQVEGTTCASAIPVALLGTATFTGTTVGGGAHQTNQCALGNGNNSADRVYAVTPLADGLLTASLVRGTTDYDSILYALRDCLDVASGILCEDSFDPSFATTLNGGEALSFPVLAGETYFIVVDGWDGDEGNYELTLDISDGDNCTDAVPFPLWPGTAMTADGFTSGSAHDAGTNTCGGNVSEDIVYELVPQFSGPIDIALIDGPTNYDAVLYARTTCDLQSSEIVCDRQGGGGEQITVTGVAGVPIYVWVDGWAGADGDYRLIFTP